MHLYTCASTHSSSMPRKSRDNHVHTKHAHRHTQTLGVPGKAQIKCVQPGPQSGEYSAPSRSNVSRNMERSGFTMPLITTCAQCRECSVCTKEIWLGTTNNYVCMYVFTYYIPFIIVRIFPSYVTNYMRSTLTFLPVFFHACVNTSTKHFHARHGMCAHRHAIHDKYRGYP
jgi:hypothetical protein